jgi:hypothetical protein
VLVLYVLAAVVIVVCLGLLVFGIRRVLGSARRFSATRTQAKARFDDQRGLLRARIAALGVAFAQRRRIVAPRRGSGGEG